MLCRSASFKLLPVLAAGRLGITSAAAKASPRASGEAGVPQLRISRVVSGQGSPDPRASMNSARSASQRPALTSSAGLAKDSLPGPAQSANADHRRRSSTGFGSSTSHSDTTGTRPTSGEMHLGFAYCISTLLIACQDAQHCNADARV